MNKILVLNTQDIYGGAARATYNTFNEIDKLNEIDIKYGVSNKTVEHIKEDFPLSVTNPYGRSKLMVEEFLQDLFCNPPKN